MSRQKLEIIYSLGVISHFDAWEIIAEFLRQQGVSSSTSVNFYEKSIALNKVHHNIEKSKRPNFKVEVEGVIFGYGAITTWNHVLIWIEDKSATKACNWNQLVEAFFNKATFIQAWISDIEYEFWQNAKDPMQYQAYNRSYTGLPMKSNGLPPPLEQQEIDISQNPGRRIIRDGFIEAVGSTMWLSEEFWKKTGVGNGKVMEIFSDKYEYIGKNIFRLQVSPEPFKNTDSIDLQKKIRNALFKTYE
jgi:hypothetical protein